MEGEKLFKTALSGFNKEDVMQYINELNRKLSSLQEDKNSLAKNYDQVLAELEETKKALAAEKEARPSIEKEQQALQERLSFVEARHTELQRSFAQLSKEKEDAVTENRQIKEKLEVLDQRCRDYESRSRIFDSSARELADIMVKSRKDAEEIIESATRTAQQEKHQIEMEISRTLEDYRQFRDKVLSIKERALANLSDLSNRVSTMDSFLREIDNSCAPFEQMQPEETDD